MAHIEIEGNKFTTIHIGVVYTNNFFGLLFQGVVVRTCEGSAFYGECYYILPFNNIVQLLSVPLLQ